MNLVEVQFEAIWKFIEPILSRRFETTFRPPGQYHHHVSGAAAAKLLLAFDKHRFMSFTLVTEANYGITITVMVSATISTNTHRLRRCSLRSCTTVRSPVAVAFDHTSADTAKVLRKRVVLHTRQYESPLSRYGAVERSPVYVQFIQR